MVWEKTNIIDHALQRVPFRIHCKVAYAEGGGGGYKNEKKNDFFLFHKQQSRNVQLQVANRVWKNSKHEATKYTLFILAICMFVSICVLYIVFHQLYIIFMPFQFVSSKNQDTRIGEAQLAGKNKKSQQMSAKKTRGEITKRQQSHIECKANTTEQQSIEETATTATNRNNRDPRFGWRGVCACLYKRVQMLYETHSSHFVSLSRSVGRSAV